MDRRSLLRNVGMGAIVVVCALLIAAILLPVSSESGPAPRAIASAIAHRHQKTHTWPSTEADYSLGPNDRPGRRYAYRLERVDRDAATYRIVVNGRAQRWRSGEASRPYRISVD